MSAPRFVRARNFKFIKRATGTDMVLAATAITDLGAATNGPGAGGFDMSLRASVGDVFEYSLGGLLSNTAVNTGFDVYTMVSGARTNPFGAGLSASLGSTVGVYSWYATSGVQVAIAGRAYYTIQAGDIASGAVSLRPHFAATGATSRTMYSVSGAMFLSVMNLGPVQS